ncbi:MAG: methyltransferase family protein [Chitinophagales bacterium]
MENRKDNPGVYIPPPLIYALTFILAVFLQKEFPINDSFFHLQWTKMGGILLFGFALFFMLRSLRQFLQSKNTIVTILPAHSLQTNGIYAITRNPMYIGLAVLYLGLSCFLGNWWNIILFPSLLLIVQEYIIKREEKYLQRRFGQEFQDYKNKVRRWL